MAWAWSMRLGAAFLLGSSALTAVRAAGATDQNGRDPYFAAPAAGGQTFGQTLQATVVLPANATPTSVRWTLNGRALRRDARPPVCEDGSCTLTEEIGRPEGLLPGKNVLQAVARIEGRSLMAKTRFLWRPSERTASPLADAAPSPVQLMLPPSLNLTSFESLSSQQAWIQIGKSSFPVLGADPSTEAQICPTPLQLLVLDRSQLTQVSYGCYRSSGELQAALANVTPQQIAVAGTTPWYHAPPGLDTSAIGGTNYSDGNQFPDAAYPQDYIVVGAGGVPAGQATENYNIDVSTLNPYAAYPRLIGMLTEDGNNNYNFQWSGPVKFAVDPAYVDPNSGAVGPAVTIGTTVYTPPPIPDGSGLWIFALDRSTLQPYDAIPGGTGSCVFLSTTATTCGGVVATGDISAQTFIRQFSDHDLLFVVGVGQPFGEHGFRNPHGMKPEVAAAIAGLGGSEYDAATFGAFNYTLVSIPGQAGYNTAVNGKAIVSTSLNANQTGRIKGLLVRDRKSLFAPTLWSQAPMVGQVPSGLNFDYHVMASQQAVDWPQMDTPGKVAAYHYLSTKLAPNNTGAPALYDYRSLYYGGQQFSVITNTTDPTQVQAVSSYDDPVSGQTVQITPDELTAVAQQLKAENETLRTVYSAFSGSGTASYSSLFQQNGAVALQLISAAAMVKSSALNPLSGAPASVNVSNILNTAAGTLATVAPLACLETGPLCIGAGIISGVLWTASGLTATNPFDSSASPVLPNPDYNLAVTVGQLAADNVAVGENLQTAFATSMDNIYSDWGKLSIVANHVVNDWLVKDQTDLPTVANYIGNALQQSFFLQLAPQQYRLDFFSSVIDGNPADIMSTYDDGQSCANIYVDYPPPASSTFSLATAQWPLSDVFIVSTGYATNSEGEPYSTYGANQGSIFQTLLGFLPARELLSGSGPFQRIPDGPISASGNQFVRACFPTFNQVVVGKQPKAMDPDRRASPSVAPFVPPAPTHE